jgi:hypothetical protein
MVSMLRKAWLDLGHDPFLPALYVGVHVAAILALRTFEHLMGSSLPDDAVPSWYPMYNLAKQFGLSALIALLQALIFSRMGRAIDRPLWKCAGHADAARRFFMPWFLLNLIGTVLQQLQINAQGLDDAGAALFTEFLFMVFYVGAVPIGAAVMYFGGLEWARLGDALAPIGRQLRHVVPVFVLMAASYVLHFLLVALLMGVLGQTGVDGAVVLPALAIGVPAFVECLAFAVMWRVLMLDRDTAMYEDPYDF